MSFLKPTVYLRCHKEDTQVRQMVGLSSSDGH